MPGTLRTAAGMKVLSSQSGGNTPMPGWGLSLIEWNMPRIRLAALMGARRAGAGTVVGRASLAGEHVSGRAVRALARVELSRRAATAGLVVDVVQRLDGLVDAADLGDGLGKAGWSFIDLQGAHDAHGRHAPQLERADQAQHIVPMRCDAVQAHALASQCVEFSVISLGINATKPCLG